MSLQTKVLTEIDWSETVACDKCGTTMVLAGVKNVSIQRRLEFRQMIGNAEHDRLFRPTAPNIVKIFSCLNCEMKKAENCHVNTQPTLAIPG